MTPLVRFALLIRFTTVLLALSAVLAGPTDASSVHTAKTVSLYEKGSLKLASTPGRTLLEKGSISGTYNGRVTSTITTFSVSRGKFWVIAYLSNGSVTIEGSTENHNYGSTGYAVGVGHVTKGTGAFAHASARSLSLKAWMNRKNFSLITELRGPLTL